MLHFENACQVQEIASYFSLLLIQSQTYSRVSIYLKVSTGSDIAL